MIKKGEHARERERLARRAIAQGTMPSPFEFVADSTDAPAGAFQLTGDKRRDAVQHIIHHHLHPPPAPVAAAPEPALQRAGEGAEHGDQVRYCLCGRTYDGGESMIGCDGPGCALVPGGGWFFTHNCYCEPTAKEYLEGVGAPRAGQPFWCVSCRTLHG